MKTKQVQIKNAGQVKNAISGLAEIQPNLILMFGSQDCFAPGGWIETIAKEFPKAQVIGCSTAGEISNDGVSDNTLVATACHFEHPDFVPVSTQFKTMFETRKAGVELAKKLDRKNLKSLFLLGKGLNINGSALIEGIREVLGNDVVITGGLAGDGGKFQQTFTVINGKVQDDAVVGLGVYGDHIKFSFGSMGGWQPFGPVRRVTRAKENVLYELDGQPALEIYKTYLGDKAKELPASGLFYPFALLKDNQDTTGIIRTILAVNEADQSLTLAGDIPENGIVRLMHANNDGLVSGAKAAAVATDKMTSKGSKTSGLGILISCVGRKLVMGTDIEDELDAVRSIFGESPVTGFYSYGEICPQAGLLDCKLHNQTMTITYIY
ncbi:MAG: FIST signal transduction protein, partial [Bdellovibrionota bacterium]